MKLQEVNTHNCGKENKPQNNINTINTILFFFNEGDALKSGIELKL